MLWLLLRVFSNDEYICANFELRFHRNRKYTSPSVENIIEFPLSTIVCGYKNKIENVSRKLTTFLNLK